MLNANPLIDWQDVLRITNNKPELAKEMVAMLGCELPMMKNVINRSFKAQNYPELLEHIHKLHGSCCYCGVPSLRNLASQLEAQLKKRQYQHLDQQLLALNSEIDIILKFMTDQAII